MQAIADAFNAEGLRTVTGKLFAPQTVYLMIGRVDPTANPVGGYTQPRKQKAPRGRNRGAQTRRGGQG